MFQTVAIRTHHRFRRFPAATSVVGSNRWILLSRNSITAADGIATAVCLGSNRFTGWSSGWSKSGHSHSLNGCSRSKYGHSYSFRGFSGSSSLSKPEPSSISIRQSPLQLRNSLLESTNLFQYLERTFLGDQANSSLLLPWDRGCSDSGRMGCCLRKDGAVARYTKLLDDAEQSTRTTDGARVSRLCENNKLIEFYFDDVTTVYEAFQRGVRVSGDNPCLGWKPDSATPYKWMSYNEVNQRATNFGSGLMGIGVKPDNEIRIGVYSQNRPEYVIADQAFCRHSLTGVPLYDTLGVDACGFIINQADLSIIVCDNNDKVKKLLDRRKDYPHLHTLILMEPISQDSKTRAASEGVKLLQFTEIEKSGEKNPVNATPAKPDDLYIVCYTSGTTGTPKGAMISHGNIIGSMAGALRQLDACGVGLCPDDIMMSYLPLAHSYERILETSTLGTGGAIGFFQGDVKKLMDDIKELRPTIFPSVPGLLNRLYDKVSSGVNASKVKKILFGFAMSSKTKELKRGVIRNNSIWDKIVFGKIQTALGGRVRAITTGSAPLSAEVLTFLRCIVGCPILEGYGQTENSAVATLTIVGDGEAGHVGPPLPSNMIKLADVPEMDYYSNNNKGEVCIKGPNVFKGYLKDEEKTKEAIDGDGWLHTGDIGEWLPSGALKIIDRKKNIFKLAQGEYIAPEKIENVLIQSPYLAQVYVHGNSLESYLVGVVVPDPESLPGLASKLGLSGSFEEMCCNQVLKKAILDDLTQLAKKCGLSSLEQMKDIHICSELFSVENGLLTPTFKTKRNVLATHFDKEISVMYERTNAALAAKS